MSPATCPTCPRYVQSPRLARRRPRRRMGCCRTVLLTVRRRDVAAPAGEDASAPSREFTSAQDAAAGETPALPGSPRPRHRFGEARQRGRQLFDVGAGDAVQLAGEHAADGGLLLAGPVLQHINVMP